MAAKLEAYITALAVWSAKHYDPILDFLHSNILAPRLSYGEKSSLSYGNICLLFCPIKLSLWLRRKSTLKWNGQKRLEATWEDLVVLTFGGLCFLSSGAFSCWRVCRKSSLSSSRDPTTNQPSSTYSNSKIVPPVRLRAESIGGLLMFEHVFMVLLGFDEQT